LDSAPPQEESGYYRNWISFLGMGLLLFGFFSGFILFLFELLSSDAAPYLGILYLLFTGLIVAGFVLIPAGMILERRRRKAGAHAGALSEFVFDLRVAEHRYVALSLLVSGLLVIVLSGVGAYQSFHATESVAFCGQLCHSVMNPEWVRYNDSPHARVRCAECHIGAGADWFVRSKLSGLRQVWATALDTFSRPTPTPIHDLRPARETCEECHWRRKFVGYKELVRSYYLSDEENSLHQLRMLLKIGGEKTTFLQGSGIHYHMLIASKVEYIATDERRQEIAWVRVTRADGSVSEFNHQGNGIGDEEKATLEMRTMDCIDCHNRPSHQYPPPMERVNEAIAAGSISQDIPYIKVQAVTALDRSYDNVDQALVGIANELREYYRSEYPEFLNRRRVDLTRAIKKVQSIYEQTIFPEMKADWSAYPDNIGHRDTPGCFRCHTDEMVSDDGQAIFTDCTKCHLILAQGETIDQVNVNIEEGLPFVHPEDFDTIEEFTECADCHTGGAAVYEE
jgi:nitrate/TMAO reductase-like tetraheme cytochrome c subunit